MVTGCGAAAFGTGTRGSGWPERSVEITLLRPSVETRAPAGAVSVLTPAATAASRAAPVTKTCPPRPEVTSSLVSAPVARGSGVAVVAAPAGTLVAALAG